MDDFDDDFDDRSNETNITIDVGELDDYIQEHGVAAQPPMRQYRPGGCLTVTDLVQPAWCEIQYRKKLQKEKSGERTPRAQPGGSSTQSTVPGTQPQTDSARQSQSQSQFGRSNNQIRQTDGRVLGTQSQMNTARHSQTQQSQRGGGSTTGAFDRRIQSVRSSTVWSPTTVGDIRANTKEERFAKRVVTMTRGLDQLSRFKECDNMDLLGVFDNVPIIGKVLKLTLRQDGTASTITIKNPKPHPKRTPDFDTEHITILKLACYHRLLSDLFSERFSFQTIWDKLGIDSTSPLSLEFNRQASDFVRLEHSYAPRLVDYTNEFHRLRTQLVNTTIDPTMVISYRPGTVLGEEPVPDFRVECAAASEMLDAHLPSVLAWWKGERKEKGVDVENAWKCRTCDYARDCDWRRTNGGTLAIPLPV